MNDYPTFQSQVVRVVVGSVRSRVSRTSTGDSWDGSDGRNYLQDWIEYPRTLIACVYRPLLLVTGKESVEVE